MTLFDTIWIVEFEISYEIGKLLEMVLTLRWVVRKHLSPTRHEAIRSTTISNSITLLAEVGRATNLAIKKRQVIFSTYIFLYLLLS
jgi:hypothetical protein